MAIFITLLQVFWESWDLRTLELWSFPTMLLMLSSPICLYLMAYILFPEPDETAGLDNYYFERARLIWPLGALTVIVGTLFRPVTFGDTLWVSDNLSRVPILVVCGILTIVRNRVTHRILVPVVLAFVLWDTLKFSQFIGKSDRR